MEGIPQEEHLPRMKVRRKIETKMKSALSRFTVPSRVQWDFEGVSVVYDATSPSMRWWFGVRHKKGEIHEEPVTRLFLGLINGKTNVIDIGARWGHYALAAASKIQQKGGGGRVLAIDLDKDALALLERQVEVNRFNNIAVQAITLGERNSDTSMTLDSVINEHNLVPELIKCDIEGHEADVLVSGASEMLSTHQPDLVVEVHPNFLADLGWQTSSFLQKLTEQGYFLYRVEGLRETNKKTTLEKITDYRARRDGQFMIYASVQGAKRIQKFVNG
jgi:23S rRNA U2552 (ribose-2'-O)-methylase RlmE/FtsJ